MWCLALSRTCPILPHHPPGRTGDFEYRTPLHCLTRKEEQAREVVRRCPGGRSRRRDATPSSPVGSSRRNDSTRLFSTPRPSSWQVRGDADVRLSDHGHEVAGVGVGVGDDPRGTADGLRHGWAPARKTTGPLNRTSRSWAPRDSATIMPDRPNLRVSGTTAAMAGAGCRRRQDRCTRGVNAALPWASARTAIPWTGHGHEALRPVDAELHSWPPGASRRARVLSSLMRVLPNH